MKNNLNLHIPDDAEDAQIAKGIALDANTYELSDHEISLMRKVGRPRGSGKKTQVTMSLDTDLLEYLRKQGKGWQTTANNALRKAIGLPVS